MGFEKKILELETKRAVLLEQIDQWIDLLKKTENIHSPDYKFTERSILKAKNRIADLNKNIAQLQQAIQKREDSQLGLFG